MQITSTLLVLLFLLAAHVILLPLLKRRPVFIKGLEGALILGVFLFPIERLFHRQGSGTAQPHSMREAMYYTSGDNLAG